MNWSQIQFPQPVNLLISSSRVSNRPNKMSADNHFENWDNASTKADQSKEVDGKLETVSTQLTHYTGHTVHSTHGTQDTQYTRYTAHALHRTHSTHGTQLTHYTGHTVHTVHSSRTTQDTQYTRYTVLKGTEADWRKQVCSCTYLEGRTGN